MKSFVVTKAEEGQSSLKYCQRILKEAPVSFFYKMFRKKNITCNGKKLEGNEKVKAGDEIRFFLSDETFIKFSGALSGTAKVSDYMEAFARFGEPLILYEDDHVLIFDKPVDMLSQKAGKDDLSANEWIIGYLLYHKKLDKESLQHFMPSVCNRLDRNTGGLLLFGKTPFGAERLNSLLRDRTIHKYYETLVKGEIKDAVRVKSYLYKDEKTNKVMISADPAQGYDPIETEYAPLAYDAQKDLTLLKVLLVTGKTHQIRAHLAYLGHPILGDFKYGDPDFNQSFHQKFQILYAVELVFPTMPDYPDLSGKTIRLDRPEAIQRILK